MTNYEKFIEERLQRFKDAGGNIPVTAKNDKELHRNRGKVRVFNPKPKPLTAKRNGNGCLIVSMSTRQKAVDWILRMRELFDRKFVKPENL